MGGRREAMTSDELNRRLQVEKIVPLTASDWHELAGGVEELERHATGVAGDLLIIRVAEGLCAVEESARDERVVRRLSDSDEARRFVERRLDEYERMWDGCGCKIDYYR
jgi:hypothetical protein